MVEYFIVSGAKTNVDDFEIQKWPKKNTRSIFGQKMAKLPFFSSILFEEALLNFVKGQLQPFSQFR